MVFESFLHSKCLNNKLIITKLRNQTFHIINTKVTYGKNKNFNIILKVFN